VLVASSNGTISSAVAAMKSGAFDFIEVPFKPERLLGCIRSVSGAEPYRRQVWPAQAIGPLTAREQQILERIERGKSNSEIAAALAISPRTVEFHRTNLLRKFGVRRTSHMLLALSQHRARPDKVDRAEQIPVDVAPN
jgi:FixJ family two-component response regulator